VTHLIGQSMNIEEGVFITQEEVDVVELCSKFKNTQIKMFAVKNQNFFVLNAQKIFVKIVLNSITEKDQKKLTSKHH
jgi:hypothetical protein